jgi:cytochrome c-type biogenesis protein CcmH
MPLAALKLKAADLPYSFSLSDANALGGAKLSQAAAVRIEAKIAKGGTPSTMPGDLIGKSTVVKPGAKNLRIVIDSEAK